MRKIADHQIDRCIVLEGEHAVGELGVARGEMDAPDIDTTVFVNKKLPVGQFADVTIKEWRGYDLVAA